MTNTVNPAPYDFFNALSDRIGALVQHIADETPDSFSYRGMDFRHAFESWLYFSLANDRALQSLYRREGVTGAIPPFSSELAYLMADFWFGARAATVGRAFSTWVAGLVRPLRPFIGRGRWTRRAPSQKADLLLFATSLRFAKYMMPVADAWKGSCAFLVQFADTDLQAALIKAGYAVVTYGPAAPKWRRVGGHLARYAPGLALLADEIEEAMLASGAHVVLLPEGNAPEDEVVNRVGREIGVKVACIQQGWSPLVHAGFRNMSYDAMLVWGQGFADLLAPHNPHQRFVAVGNHVLFETFDVQAWKRNGVAIFGMGQGLWLQPEDERLLMSLAPYAAERLPEHMIYVRPHPRYPFGEETLRAWARYPNIQIAAWPDVSLTDVLARSRIAVSVYSSTILESIAADAVPVIFNMTTMPRFMPDVDHAGAGIEVRTFEQASEAILKLMADEAASREFAPAIAAFQERYFAARGRAALNAIVAELERGAARSLSPSLGRSG